MLSGPSCLGITLLPQSLKSKTCKQKTCAHRIIGQISIYGYFTAICKYLAQINHMKYLDLSKHLIYSEFYPSIVCYNSKINLN